MNADGLGEAGRDRAFGIRPPQPLPDELRLGRVCLQVSDLDRSLAYYAELLGLRVLGRGSDRALLGTEDRSPHPLVELHTGPAVVSVPRRTRLGLFHFAILLPDRSALGRVVQHLADHRVPFGASDHLVSEALYLSDPDGLGIEIYSDRPRATWEVQGRELRMDTRPLNLADVVRAAGEEKWVGMPAGTQIGHVHLHVGDLAQASAFYHQGLGFERVVWSYPGAMFRSASGYHHHLGVNTWAGPGALPPGPHEARLLDWEILLPSNENAEAAARSLARAGYRPTRESGGWTVDDPWGTTLRITVPSTNDHRDA